MTAAELFAVSVAANLVTVFMLGVYAYSLWDMTKRGVNAHNLICFGVATLFTLTAGYSLHQLLAG